MVASAPCAVGKDQVAFRQGTAAFVADSVGVSGQPLPAEWDQPVVDPFHLHCLHAMGGREGRLATNLRSTIFPSFRRLFVSAAHSSGITLHPTLKV